MKPKFYWWWLGILLSPFIEFAIVDYVGYWLRLHGIPGYPPLTDILAGYIPIVWLVAATFVAAAVFSIHWIIAYHDLFGRVRRFISRIGATLGLS